jgi:hypothetical protein
MPVTRAQLRTFVLALDGVEERPHMERMAFRTKRKTFLTIGADARVNLLVQPEDKRDSLLESFPDAIFSLGGWTRLGFVAVDLDTVDEALLRELVTDAWRDALPVTKTKAKGSAKPKVVRRST